MSFIVLRVYFKKPVCYNLWSIEISRELKNPSLVIPQSYVVDERTYFFVLFFEVTVLLFLAAVCFFGADFFAAVSFFFGAGFLSAIFFFFGTDFFLGAAFLLGAADFFSEAIWLFLNSDNSLYELLICMKSPEAMPDFNPDIKVTFKNSCLLVDQPAWFF